jgi:hypothetical protein
MQHAGRTNGLAQIRRILVSAWSDSALIRAHGQFALHEMFALSLFGTVMSGCGSG